LLRGYGNQVEKDGSDLRAVMGERCPKVKAYVAPPTLTVSAETNFLKGGAAAEELV
jgi:hypothetical protein